LRAVRELPVDVAPVVEDVVDRFEVRLEYRRRFVRGGDGPLCLMTQRRRLDAHLAEQAAAAGANFRDASKVDDLELDDDGVSATVGGARVRAKALVGADGVNGVVPRALGLDGRELGVALEGNCGHDRIDPERYAGRLVLEVGVVPGGYGWAFPKGDHVNFGIGGWESEGPRLRDHLRRLCAAHGVEPKHLTDVRGYRLPMRRPDSGLVRGRALLVGDAAGLVDPLSGDGLYEAFVSARLATRAILDLLEGRAKDLGPYMRATIEALGPNAAASWSAKVALDRFPRLAFVVAPLAWPTVARLVRGEIDRPGQARRLARAPLRVLKRLAIEAGDRGEAFRSALPQS
jgi:geranylgeranyl reductase family protein